MRIVCLVLTTFWLIAPPSVVGQDAKITRAPAIAIIEKKIDTEIDSLLALYKQIHAHPELAFQEVQTSARLAKELRQLGFDVTERVGVTGIVGVFKNGDGPIILVRADMDALPIVELTGASYASKRRTRDQDGLDVGVMHACGHDMNVACLVGAARVMTSMKERWKGTLVFIGQPAEEIGAGAKAMLEAGLLQKFPRPDFALAMADIPPDTSTIAKGRCKRMSIRWTSSCAAKGATARRRTRRLIRLSWQPASCSICKRS